MPSDLIALIASLDNPLAALQNWDQANELHAAFSNQFGFINFARFANTPIQAENLPRCRYAIDDLVQALANLHQTAVVMQVSGALAIEQSLRVGRISDNPYVQLAAAYRTVAGPRHPRNRTSQLTLSDQHLLSELLLKVAADGPRWQAWMEIFNKYPGRVGDRPVDRVRGTRVQRTKTCGFAQTRR